jgi:nitrogen PTS system EIIA component
MTIADFLTPSDVLMDLRVSGKRQVLQELARKAGASLKIAPETIVAELLKREDLGSTGMGGGIAIPHARLDGVDKPLGVLARLAQPVEFEAIDDKPVDLVFLLVLPSSAGGEQLSALAAVARLLRTPDVLTQLRRAKSARELFAAIF